MYEKVSDAIILAANAHKGQYSKLAHHPYILHPLQVAAIIASITPDEDVITAGILHDVIEDAGVKPETILEQFGERVYHLVLSETEDKRPELPKSETWVARKTESLEILKNTDDMGIKALWLSDKLANMRSYYASFQQLGSELWNCFNQKDPEMHKWYYNEVLKYTKELSNTAAYKELSHLYTQIFGGEQK